MIARRVAALLVAVSLVACDDGPPPCSTDGDTQIPGGPVHGPTDPGPSLPSPEPDGAEPDKYKRGADGDICTCGPYAIDCVPLCALDSDDSCHDGETEKGRPTFVCSWKQHVRKVHDMGSWEGWVQKRELTPGLTAAEAYEFREATLQTLRLLRAIVDWKELTCFPAPT